MEVNEKARDWLKKHQWFLKHHQLSAEAATYVFKSGFLAGLESSQSQTKLRLERAVRDLSVSDQHSDD
jgi:hypothetical protein